MSQARWRGRCKTSSCHSERCTVNIYESFISGIFHLIFSDYGRLWVTKAMESGTVDKGRILYRLPTGYQVYKGSNDRNLSLIYVTVLCGYSWPTGDSPPRCHLWSQAPFILQLCHTSRPCGFLHPPE